MLESINRNSVYFQFLPEQTKHDLTVKHTIETAVNQDVFSDYLVTFMLNCSRVPFVLPMSGVYSYGMCDLICNNLPITPTCSIVMVNFEYGASKFIENGKVKLLRSSDDEKIYGLNKKAFQEEGKINKRGIVSGDKDLMLMLSREYLAEVVINSNVK